MMTRLRRSVSAFAPVAAHVKGRLQRFRDDESGTVLVFGLIVFTTMLAVAGMSVDLMRLEQLRTALSQTLNRSVLAAASLTQDLDAEAVVEDYFDKAGLSKYLEPVIVIETTTSSTVSARAEAIQTNFFMNLIGVDKLPAIANSTATQDINDVEIMLVLDVSGSMTETIGGVAKIDRLKTAAGQFVDTMIGDSPNQNVTIGIVPYNAQVNLGPDLFAKYNVTSQPDPLKTPTSQFKCVVLPDSAFNNTAISHTIAMTQFAYADTSSVTRRDNRFLRADKTQATSKSGTTYNSGFNDSNGNAIVNAGGTHYTDLCGSGSETNTLVYKTNSGMYAYPSGWGQKYPMKLPGNISLKVSDTQVRLPSNDPTVVKGWINKLYAEGNTSIALGMKWGLALLDPSEKPMYASFVTVGKIPTTAKPRPFDYTEDDTLKVIVLMTDGIHVAHKVINSAYLGQTLSPIYKAVYNGETYYSIDMTGKTMPTDVSKSGKNFWVPILVDDNAISGDSAATKKTKQELGWRAKAYDGQGDDVAGDSRPTVQLQWSEVWADMRVDYVAFQFYGRGLGSLNATSRETNRKNYYDEFTDDWKTESQMDDLLMKSCSLAASNGMSNAFPRVDKGVTKPILVYTIAFDAPTASQTLLKNCATKQTEEFSFAVTDNIGDAFDSIASSISYLRLTQ